VIAGKPNAGKSTLLNALLNEEKAIVSEIPGTTRDVIEDEITLGGVTFRFMDTAGLRDTQDAIESIGVSRTRDRMKNAALILYMFDLSDTSVEEINREEAELKALSIPFIKVGNKLDKASKELIKSIDNQDFILISAASKTNLESLKEMILSRFTINEVKQGDVLVTNLRHYQKLIETQQALDRVMNGLQSGITGDFLAMDIRQSLFHLGEITGEITSDDLLANIFANFCIGK
jgi:tRNA modification GTPase